MAFSFAAQPQDYMLRAQAGLSLDPSLTGDQVSGQAAQVLAAPPQSVPQAAPQPSASPSGYPAIPDVKVSPMEAFLSFLSGGGSPAEAAQRARAVKVQNMMSAAELQRSQMLMQAIHDAAPDERKAILFNPSEYGKAEASHVQNTVLKGGETLVNGPTSQPFTAPLVGVDDKSGLGYAIAPSTGLTRFGPSLGGDVSTRDGVVSSGRTGPTGQTYSMPQIAPPGSTPIPFTPGVSGAPGSAAQAGALPGARFDALNFIKSFILPHEGGLNPHDMNGAPTKFGINQAANPGVDVPNLTPDQATAIYMQKYLPASGAANLPPALAAVHLDTSIINPARAHEFLQQSGGDPAKYLQLRQAWMQHMVQNNPAAAPYARAWAQRNADLGHLIATSGGYAPTPVSSDAPPPPPPAGGFGQPFGQVTHPRILSPEQARAAGFAAGAVVEQHADGTVSIVQPPEYGPDAKSNLRNHVLTSDEYKQAQASLAAYSAMIANADKMTGPSAYSMLDTFARAINPGAVARPQVIQTIEHNLGLPAQLVGSLESKFGHGNLPPQVRQQIIDAVVPFAQAHWDQARMLNDSNTELAKAHGFKAEDVTAPLEARPTRMIVTPSGAITEAQALAQARQAVKRGVPRDKVVERLQGLHIKPVGF